MNKYKVTDKLIVEEARIEVRGSKIKAGVSSVHRRDSMRASITVDNRKQRQD